MSFSQRNKNNSYTVCDVFKDEKHQKIVQNFIHPPTEVTNEIRVSKGKNKR